MDPESAAYSRATESADAVAARLAAQDDAIRALGEQLRAAKADRDALRAENDAQQLLITTLKRSNQLLLKSSIDLINFQDQLSSTTRAYQDLATQLRERMSEDCPPTAPLPLPRLPTPKDIYPDASTANIPFSIPDSHGQGQGLQGQGQDREHASQSPAIQSATTATHANNTGGTENQPLPKVAVHAPSPNQGSDEFHPHIQLLQGFPLFASFPRSILEQISLSAYELKRKEGQVIISKGEEGAEMFFIVDGMVAVVVDGKELSRLSRPVFFGELGVLFKFQRTATIIAKTDTVLAVVTKQKLDEIVEAANPAVQLIMEEFTINKEIWWKQQQYIKSQEKFGAEFVNDIARKDLKSLEVFANAPDSFIDTLAMTLKCLVYKAGEIVIHLNEDSDCMYFVLSGTVEVVGSTGVVHAEITSGSFFGEVGILLNMKRTASIRAKTESRLFKLLKHNLDEVVAEYPSVKNKLKEAADERFYMFQMRQSFAEEGPSAPAPEQFDLEVGQNVLSKLSFFQDVDSSIVTELAMLMKRTTWETGEYIIRCGDDGKSMFFLVAGDADVITEFGDVVDQFTAPDAYFGEVAIVEQVPRTASVRCINTCSTFELKKEDVKSTMRRHPVLEKRIKDTASNRMQNYLMRNVLA